MTETLKTFLRNQIDLAEQAREERKYDPYTSQFWTGVIHMANKTMQEIQGAENPESPVPEYWEQTIHTALSDMSVSSLMNQEDTKKLFDMAKQEQHINPTVFDDKRRTHDFIERTILKINPERYGIHHIGSIVMVRQDLIVGETYGGVPFLESMETYKGMTSMIRDLDERVKGEKQNTTYTLSIDIGDHKWSKEMLTVLQNP